VPRRFPGRHQTFVRHFGQVPRPLGRVVIAIAFAQDPAFELQRPPAAFLALGLDKVVDQLERVVNLALARGMLGRSTCGLVPVRGHSGVQGAAECGSVPNAFAGGAPVNTETAAHFAEFWKHPVPDWPGMSAPEMLDAAGRGELDVFWIAGGNFLETMPEPSRMRRAMERVPCRVHQDLIVNSSMLADPADLVLLLPGQTRYEQRGGGTLTSTERRIRYSPEIPGPRVGEAMAEWEIFMRAGEAALGPERKQLVHFNSTDEIRAEMDRVMPMYRGIGGLRDEGDSIQYGGQLLCSGGVCANLPGGRARFSAIIPPLPETQAGDGSNRFYLATRRGRQFNSMVYDSYDPLTGSGRRIDVFISSHDANRLSLWEGAPVRLRSDVGTMDGFCQIVPVARGTLQVYWPEANALISSRLDPESHEPDYNAWVTLEARSNSS